MSLVQLAAEHLELILPWRNAPAVRKAMYSHHEITLQEHRAWFHGLEADPTRRWYLFFDEIDQPQGVVYFTNIDLKQGTAFWGFYAKQDAKSGTGLQMELEALDLAFGGLRLRKLSCEVLSNNKPVVNMHKKVGFTEEGCFREQHDDGDQRVDVIRLGLLASEWALCRERVQDRVLQLIELKQKSLPPPPRTGRHPSSGRQDWVHEIMILSDANSWINPYLLDLQMDWEAQGHRVVWAHDASDAVSIFENSSGAEGELQARRFCFCLSFSKIVGENFRSCFDHTLVVHESDLPKGKGWSPLTWQVLEGRHSIPVTLLEAIESVDAGPIYAQKTIELRGHELIDELRAAQALVTHELCRWFVDEYPSSAAQGMSQQGTESFYPRRGPNDSRLDVDKSLAEQFDLLRVVDNTRYPAFFECRGHRYRLTVHRH